MMRSGWVPALVIVAVVAGSFPAPAAECLLPPGDVFRVAETSGPDSILLDSGVVVRLAGVSMPSSLDDAAPAAASAELALAALVSGRSVEIRGAAPDRDRYDRIVGQVFLADASATWVEGRLVEDGVLAVQLTGSGPCEPSLLAAEAAALEGRRGFWADPAYAPLPVEAPALRGRTGAYAVVEGAVLSVGRTERTIYLNFGRDWSTDFTAVMATAVADGLDLGGIAVDDLGGRRVRLRGWVEDWNGPSMRLDHAAQIEILP